MVANKDVLGYNSGMKSGIYQIRNQMNGKRYIGSTTNLKRRWWYHLGELRRGQHSNRHLQAAFNKYGESVFVFSVLEHTDVKSLLEREQHLLDTLKPEYNILLIAGSPLGFRWTPESRAKLSAAMMGERNPNYGKHPSKETLAKLSMVRMGHSVSDKTRAKISNALRGRRLSAEHRSKLSEAAKGRRLSKATRAKMSEAQSGERNPNYGKHHSKETRAKISAAWTPERRQALSERNRYTSDATRAKMSAAQKAHWRRVRAMNEK